MTGFTILTVSYSDSEFCIFLRTTTRTTISATVTSATEIANDTSIRVLSLAMIFFKQSPNKPVKPATVGINKNSKPVKSYEFSFRPLFFPNR